MAGWHNWLNWHEFEQIPGDRGGLGRLACYAGSWGCKELDMTEQPVHSERDQPWDFFGRNGAKAETPVLWLLHVKNWLIGKDSDAGRDWGQEEKGMTEDEIVGWHHQLDGRESEWTPGDGDEQGGLACCDSWGCKELDTIERLDWTESSYFLLQHMSRRKMKLVKAAETCFIQMRFCWIKELDTLV